MRWIAACQQPSIAGKALPFTHMFPQAMLRSWKWGREVGNSTSTSPPGVWRTIGCVRHPSAPYPGPAAPRLPPRQYPIGGGTMIPLRRQLLLGLASLFVAAPGLVAQEPTTLTGSVTTPDGQPIEAVSVLVENLNLGTLTNAQGRYLVIVPASRRTGAGAVTVAASLIGRSTQRQEITLQPGTMSLDFVLEEDPLLLEEIVVTGAGLATQRQRLGVTINSVNAEEIELSQEVNIVSALAGKAPNVEVTSSAGDPGAGSYVRIRGANSLVGDNQPLFVVDGQPIDNSSNYTESTVAG